MPRVSRRQWPQPLMVGQDTSVLPDGSQDPAHTTDCGEACVASAATTVTGLKFTPGCVRQMLGRPTDDGTTTADELYRFWAALGRRSTVGSGSNYAMAPAGITLRDNGLYRVLLGAWDGPELHWVLAFEDRDGGYYVMDPLWSTYRHMSFAELHGNGVGQWVNFE